MNDQPARSAKGDAVLALAGVPILPLVNGYAVRASNLIREISKRHRVIYAGPLGDASMSDLESLGIARVVPIAQFRGWNTVFDDADRAAIRQTVDGVLREERPMAAVAWPGSDIAFDHPSFPPRILDRMDSEIVMAWRDAKHVSGVTNKLRALRNLGLWVGRERAFVRAAFATIVDTDVDCRAMRLVSGRSSVHVVASGVDVQPISPPSDEAPDPTVVFTGSLSFSANVDAVRWFVASVWPRVRASVPAARFVAAGRSPAPEILALRNEAGIEVRGDVPDMWAVLRAAWLAIAPLETGSGIRTKVLEAWAVGRPVVASPVGASGLHLDADARSVVVADAASMAAAIVKLLTNAAERHRLGASAHALVSREHNGWTRAGNRLTELLLAAAASGNTA